MKLHAVDSIIIILVETCTYIPLSCSNKGILSNVRSVCSISCSVVKNVLLLSLIWSVSWTIFQFFEHPSWWRISEIYHCSTERYIISWGATLNIGGRSSVYASCTSGPCRVFWKIAAKMQFRSVDQAETWPGVAMICISRLFKLVRDVQLAPIIPASTTSSTTTWSATPP